MNHATELEFLMNPVLYQKYAKKADPISAADAKFYRRRVLQLTRNMFKENKYPPSLRGAFEEYIKLTISYLKTEDTKDIIQEEYDHLEMESELDTDIPDPLTIEGSAKQIFNTPVRSIKDFVTITRTTETRSVPEKKSIELSDPKLKMKGVKKKKKKV
jgi:hypothetical protein